MHGTVNLQAQHKACVAAVLPALGLELAPSPHALTTWAISLSLALVNRC